MTTRTASTMAHVGAVSLAALLATGCLSTAHRISNHDLRQIAHAPPEQRGKHVRVVQSFHGDEPPAAQPVHAHTTVVVVGDGHHHHGEHRHGARGPSAGARGGGSGGKSIGSQAAKAAAEDGKATLILAAAVAAGLAFTEGARFDGWVDLHPMHPVHMYGPYGQYRVVPLAQVTPELAAWSRKAYVRPGEGPWVNAERAPLNRRGWTYSVMFGSAQIPSGQEARAGIDSESVAPGFLGHIQLGRFVTKQTGVLLDFGLGWRANEFGNTVFEARNAVELQHLPLAAGAFHAGGYGQVGIGLRAEDGPYDTSEKRALIAGVGALAQIELTTRLAVTGRVGYTRIFGEDTAEASLGLSIY